MKKLLVLVVLCAVFVACAGNPPPQPPIDPAQKCAGLKLAADEACKQPASQLCTAAQLVYSASGCGTYVPPVPPVKTCADITCQAGFSCKQPDPTKDAVCVQDPVAEHEPVCQPNQNCNCWVQPPGGEWAKLGCSAGQTCDNFVCKAPAPVCPTCPTGYSCTNPAIGCVKDGEPLPTCNIPDAEAPGWGAPIPVEQRPALMYQKYKDAIEKVGNRCGYASADESKQMQTLKDIATELRKAGVCAEQWSDSVAIFAPDDLYEEWHAVYFGNGCIIDGPNAYKGAWPFAGEVPPVQPPTVYGCPPPQPERVWTVETLPPGWGQDQIGQPRWKLNSSPHGAWIDTTAVTTRNNIYGEAIGMSPDANGTPRAGVPMRPEGPTRVEECPEYIPGPYNLTLSQCQSARNGDNRVECERYIAEGTWITDSNDGQQCEQNPSNSAQFRARGGHCRLCNPAKTVCTDWY